MKSPIWMVYPLLVLHALISGCSNPPPPPPTQGLSMTLADQLADNTFGAIDPDVHYIPVLDAGDEVKLGARFDTLTGKIIDASTCIAGYSEVERGNSSSQMRLVEVTDSQSMMRAMNIDASVQGSFLVSSVDAKASFVSNQKYTQQTQHFLLYAQATRKPRTLDPKDGETLFELTHAAHDALKKGPSHFRTVCGDGFIASVYEGVELYGMLTFDNVSLEDKKTISASMKGSYGKWNASASATSTVENYADKGRSNLEVSLNGQCSAINISGDKVADRWNNVVNSSSSLQGCADKGANLVSFKVVPYSSQRIKDWPDMQQQDPEFSLILNRYARYGTILDSINQLLTDRANAYQLALLNRGVTFQDLEKLGDEIRAKRLSLLDLLNACQSSADPQNRASDCSTNQEMLTSLDNFPDPYLYWAQLPVFFAAEQPREAYQSDAQLTALIRSHLQQRKDNACALADKYGYTRDPACPADFSQLLQQAVERIRLAPYPWPLNSGYVFITQSTSTNRCMVAPGKKASIATTATCSKPYTKHQQRFLWGDNYQLYLRKGSGGDECLSGRELAHCDTKKPAQLWRFVPSLNDPKVGLLQSAENRCLHHANVDRNVTYKGCSADALTDDNFLWRAVSGQ